MPLSKLQVINVCQPKGEVVCRYLSEDEFDPNIYFCLKKTSRKSVIDEMVEKSTKGKKDTSDMPIGDNCKGYPLLRHVEVGYDKKN
jgi:hypothetical protein